MTLPLFFTEFLLLDVLIMNDLFVGFNGLVKNLFDDLQKNFFIKEKPVKPLLVLEKRIIIIIVLLFFYNL